MDELSASKYNYFYDNNDCVLAYNTLSNSFAIMKHDEYESFLNFTERNETITKTLKKELAKGFFLISKSFNELSYLKNRNTVFSEHNDSISLTIAPTLDCNFRCIYCYEKNNRSKLYMNRKIENCICNYVKERIKNKKNLMVTWYGGEPLLALETIQRLSNYFIKIANENNVKYKAGIVTNGYLLNEETVSIIKEASISNCQITIDGNKETHDKRRFLENGSGTFDAIIENIVKYGNKLDNLVIRTNIDKKNASSYNSLRTFFKDKGLDKIRILPAPVRNTWECFEQNYCFSMEEYYNFELEDINAGNIDLIMKSVPSIRGNHCTANAKDSLVISPNGNLCKCWCDIGIDEKKVGNIMSIELLTKDDLSTFFDPFSDEKCSTCKLLPVCLGGCFHDRKYGTFGTCISIKSNEEKYIRAIFQYMLNRNKK